MLLRRSSTNIHKFGKIIFLRESSSLPVNQSSSHDDSTNKNTMFDNKLKQQMSERIPRIEKIEVTYEGRGIADNAVMYMNKHLSTPYHCAMHISHGLAQRGVIALVKPQNNEEQNDEVNQDNVIDNKEEDPSLIYSMNQPLDADCRLQFLKFNMSQATPWHHQQVNKAYWRSCAFILGAITKDAFQTSFSPHVYKFPDISEKSGAFCCDIVLDEAVKDWKVTEESLVYLTKLARGIISKQLKFEPLLVEPEFAMEMFHKDNYRRSEIEKFHEKNPLLPISVYRLGNYIDVTSGPLIMNTSMIFHYVVTAIHKLHSNANVNSWRMQGLSLPEDLKVHHTVWSLLEKRARKLVREDMYDNDTCTSSSSNKENLLKYESIENKTKIYSKATGQWVNNKWASADPTR
uniref:39S ribosomal protein L39, mitochondrial n=1 Tax=Phallusia mammillata TaxID=59560 RepID=A0A6F9DM27_9ASCI|nr:39S ribosomal protein L39, mitochondrial [Phallusia mammillata]